MWHQVGDDRLKVLGREISIHSPLRRYYLARNSILMLKQPHIHWQYKVRELFYTVSRVVVYIALVPQKENISSTFFVAGTMVSSIEWVSLGYLPSY
jgi:rhamnosyltransferase